MSNCYAAEAGIGLIREVGVPAIEARIRELTGETMDRLTASGCALATPCDDARRGPQVAIRSKDAAVTERLAARGVVVWWREDKVRAMFHGYNNGADIDARAAAAGSGLRGGDWQRGLATVHTPSRHFSRMDWCAAKRPVTLVTGLAADYATWRIREPNSDHFGDPTCIDLTRESVMEMHQVRYFLAVAQELNFSRAAEKCNVSQPSLSRAMQQLEGELGGPLFRRERHLTHLTELGAMVRPHLETVYEAALKAKRLSQDIKQLKKVPLKLGIMSTISPDEIVDLIAALKTRHDGLELRLCDASAQELRELLLAGDLEIVIYALPGEEPDERVHIMPLFAEQMVITVHRGHRLAGERAFPVRELDGECYIHRMNCEFAGYADHILKEKGVTCTPTYWSERDDWTLAMVAAGLGFAFMPENAAHHPDIVALPVIEPEFWRKVNLVTVRGRPYSPGVGALVREAMRKKWFGNKAIAAQLTEQG